MDNVFFDNWASIGRTLVGGICGYIGIIILLRISGKRTLSKFNMFDFIVTVAFGSVLATMLVSKNTSTLQGLTAFAVLIGLQFIVTWLASHFSSFESVIKAEPRLLFRNGFFLEAQMKKERISKDELEAAIRDSSIGTFEHVGAVVLETDGTMSVIPKEKLGNQDCLPER